MKNFPQIYRQVNFRVVWVNVMFVCKVCMQVLLITRWINAAAVKEKTVFKNFSFNSVKILKNTFP